MDHQVDVLHVVAAAALSGLQYLVYAAWLT
jgi:hypothetical protein